MAFRSAFKGLALSILAACAPGPGTPPAADLEGADADPSVFLAPSPGAATLSASSDRVAIVQVDSVAAMQRAENRVRTYDSVYLPPGYHCVGYLFGPEPILGAGGRVSGSAHPAIGCFDAGPSRVYILTTPRRFSVWRAEQEYPRIVDRKSGQVMLGQRGDPVQGKPTAKLLVSFIGGNATPSLPFAPARHIVVSYDGMDPKMATGIFGTEGAVDVPAGRHSFMITAVNTGNYRSFTWMIDLDPAPGQVLRLAIGRKGLYVIDDATNRVLRRPG